MNVLFIGTADVTVKYLADRLYREGNSVSWITSEKKKQLWNRNFQGKVYRTGYQAEHIRKILRLHGVDTVIFSFGTENGAHIPALRNTLQAVKAHPVQRFVYFSSIELEYHQVYPPHLAEYQYGEALCRSAGLRELLPVLILRPGIVYGDCAFDEMGLMGKLLECAAQGRIFESRRSGESYLDLLYAEDAAVAVNDLLKLGKTGEYRILTGHPVRWEELQRQLEKLFGRDVQVQYLDEEKTLPKERYWQYSRKLKEDTGWMPFYLLEQKGRDVLAAAIRHQESGTEKVQEAKTERNHPGIRLFRMPLFRNMLEILVLFAVMQFLLPFTKDRTDLRYIDVRLLYVAFSAVTFGMRIGFAATALACVSYAYGLQKEGIDLTFLMYSVETWIPFILYGIAGAALGYMADRKDDAVEESREKYENLYERYTFLQNLHREALEMKAKLQQQISASRESFGKVYEVAEHLNTLQPEQVFFHAIDVVTDTFGSCQAAIWILNQEFSRYARRKACSAQLGEVLPNSLNMEEYPLLAQGFEEENLFVNRGLQDAYPDFAAPVYHNGRIIAFIAIYQVDPERFTLYYQNLFKMIVGLIENSLVRALEFEEKRRGEIYLPGTEIMNTEEFAARLKLMEAEQERSYHTYLKLRMMPDSGADLAEVSRQLRAVIRENDFAGITAEREIQIVLVNAVESDFAVIRKRFAGRGLEVSLC